MLEFFCQNFPFTIHFGEDTLSGTYALGMVVNSRYVAGYKINNSASCDDGYVNVILVKDAGKKRGI